MSVAGLAVSAGPLLFRADRHETTGELTVAPSGREGLACREPAAIVALAVVGPHTGTLALMADGVHAGRSADLLLPVGLDDIDQAPAAKTAVHEVIEPCLGTLPASQCRVPAWPDTPAIEQVERFAFYERTREAFAVVMTGDTAKYGNIILKKGVIPKG